MRPLAPLALLLVGCAGRYVDVEVAARPPAAALGSVAVAPAVLLADLAGAVTEGPFRDGLFVGNLVFAGGYVTEQQELGLQNVSARITELAADTYRSQGTAATDALVTEALDAAAIPWTRIAPLDPALLPPPRRTPERGTYADVGHDNQNLPLFTLEPTPLTADALRGLPPGQDALVVPYVVHYYTHNGGWFVGQTWGTAAGARYRVLIVAYDADTGAPIAWTDLRARYLHDRIFQPNSVQLEDFLIATERAAQREAARVF